MNGGPDWARIDRLFEEGLEVPVAERTAWLKARCGDDEILRGRLERMFAAHEAPGFLDRPIAIPAGDIGPRLSAALAERYVIESLLGAGGMATVYRAHEEKHDRPVVLKVLDPALSNMIGEGRFKDEVRIAARLAHPNILPLIDSGTVDGLFYYVMPFVGGESVRARLKREGAFPMTEVVQLLRDVADALAHAHAAGIVHRDLKPDNVLVVEGHAFLIDFGIAKLDARETRPHATAPGLPLGTPGYMAPEQAAGMPIDHRADLYAWGVLARELLTGAHDGSRTIDAHRPDTPRALQALVEVCLAFDPAERPQSAKSLVAALDAILAAKPTAKRWPAVAASVSVAALLFVAFVWLKRPPEVPAAGSVAGPVAVMPLSNETADTSLAGWGRLAGDWVTQGLHESGLLPVIPWPTMVIAAADHQKEGGDPVAMIHRQTGAATVVTGAYYRTGDSLRFQASITDARSGRLLAAIPPVVVSADSASAAVRELRDRLMGAVAVSFDERLPYPAAVATRPPTWDAYRLFDQGLTEFNAYRYGAATELMTRAWHADTTFVPALIYASLSAMNDGEEKLADSLTRQVQARRAQLSGYHVALGDFLEAYIAGDRGRALAPIQRAISLAPGSRAAYNAAYILLQLNRPSEADSLLRTLDPDHGPMRAWPSYWSQRAYAMHFLGRHEDEIALAREMKRRFPNQRVAWVIEARALAALGRRGALDSLFAAAATLDPDVYWSQGGMRVVAAEEFGIHGTGDSLAAHREAATWLEGRLADKPKDRNHRIWLSQAMLGLSRFDRAESLLEALDREDDRGERERMPERWQLATLAARRGNVPLAARRLGNSPGATQGEHLIYQARVAALQGKRDDAIAKLSEALRLGVYNWHWMHHELQRDFAGLRGDPRLARLLAPIPPAPQAP